MNQKHTYNSVKNFLLSKNIAIISTTYIGITRPINVSCLICAYEWTSDFAHLKRSDRGCPNCSGNLKYTYDSVKSFLAVKQIKLISPTYANNKTKLDLECLICHHPWSANFHNLKNGKTGCPNCYEINIRPNPSNKLSLKETQNYAQSKNGKCNTDKYEDSKTPMPWTCERGHDWNATFDNVKNGDTWCPKCIGSKAQREIDTFIQSLGFETLYDDRSIISPFELDIFIPSKNIAIEYCGLYYHGEKLNPDNGRKRHLNKLKNCQSKNVRLITIFEDEWLLKPEQTKGYLKAILGKTENKIDARKCQIKEVPNKVAKQFHDDNHIQGKSNGKHIGLYFNDELMCIATFAKPSASRNAAKNNANKMELMRYTVKINHQVRGGLGRLLKHFIKNNPGIQEITSYSDNRWSAGNLYKALGFELITTGDPSYFYFQANSIERRHRYNFTKYRALELYGGDPNTETEWSIMAKNGWDRIWDCGSTRWVFKITR